jgi:hypothetical protein
MPSAKRDAFLDLVESLDPDTAVADLRAAAVAPSTRGTYSSEVEKYVAFVDRFNAAHGTSHSAFPASVAVVELFAAFLKASSYRNPAVAFFAVLRAAKDRGQPEGWMPAGKQQDILNGLERGKAGEEQARPINMPLLRRLAAGVKSQQDMDVFVAVLAAFFMLVRVDSLTKLRSSDILPLPNGGTQVRVGNLKGEIKISDHKFEFEQLQDPPAPFQISFLSPDNRPVRRSIPCCPASLLRLLRTEAVESGRASLVAFPTAQKLQRSFDVLVSRSGIENVEEGRARKLYTMHSTRVGGVCSLLKAGLEPRVVSAIAAWASDQVRRYGDMVMRLPGCATAFPFYNPVALAGSYRAGNDGSPAAKRVKRG